MKKKIFNFTNPSLTQIEMINIGLKSLPIIIGPYSRVSKNYYYVPLVDFWYWMPCHSTSPK